MSISVIMVLLGLLGMTAPFFVWFHVPFKTAGAMSTAVASLFSGAIFLGIGASGLYATLHP